MKLIEIIRHNARLRWNKQKKATSDRKKKQGYKFWCFLTGSDTHYRVYFRSKKSAEHFINNKIKVGYKKFGHKEDLEIYEL
jgi:hypothetical protein